MPRRHRKSRKDSFLTTTNSQYIEHLYAKWREDPNSVPQSWDYYFRRVNVEGEKSPVVPSASKNADKKEAG